MTSISDCVQPEEEVNLSAPELFNRPIGIIYIRSTYRSNTKLGSQQLMVKGRLVKDILG